MFLNQRMSFSTFSPQRAHHRHYHGGVLQPPAERQPARYPWPPLPGIDPPVAWLHHCHRLRTLCDLAQAVQSSLLIAFLITPVLWTPDQLGADKQLLLTLNPLADLLRVVREPLLGQVPSLSEWIGAAAYSLGDF
jgi:hypothetical protein